MNESPVAPKNQQNRALGASTLAFSVCFAVWTIFSIIGVKIKQDLGLNETQFGILVATPILTGSLGRIVLGIWSDRYGGRTVYAVLMPGPNSRRGSMQTIALRVSIAGLAGQTARLRSGHLASDVPMSASPQQGNRAGVEARARRHP